jgi:2-polyprenyl-3-methyl-5-hydroxy-6-metoxy-1,4-benzoquinol methylase
MIIKYSKNSTDTQKEATIRLKEDNQRFQKQLNETNTLLDGKSRKKCLLCEEELKGEYFTHRNIVFVSCSHCGHIQTVINPPNGYPNQKFSSIYPQLSVQEYQDRKTRIYRPKLDWILYSLKEFGYSMDQIKQMSWIEMGAGGGYFLSALLDTGMQNIKGFEKDALLVKSACSHISKEYIVHYENDLCKAVDDFPADIYLAFFILEHIVDPKSFFLKLKNLPRGTIFVFSVPVFGFSCLLENAFQENYARNLDCVVHTQLYTDKSINYCMEASGFEIVAKWIFGQDAEDLIRFVTLNISKRFSAPLIEKMTKDFVRLQNNLQECFDRLELSDQRHIIAIKR